MADEDRDRWEARYRAGSNSTEEPDPVLRRALALAPPAGRALDVACGRGRHAIALARAGYAVDAIDISPTAVASGRERGRGLGISWRIADLDAAGLERGVYAIVVCVDFTDERLVPRVLASLAPGGVLAYAAHPRASCRHGPRPGDVARWFAPLETLVHEESESRVDYVGRKPPG